MGQVLDLIPTRGNEILNNFNSLWCRGVELRHSTRQCLQNLAATWDTTWSWKKKSTKWQSISKLFTLNAYLRAHSLYIRTYTVPPTPYCRSWFLLIFVRLKQRLISLKVFMRYTIIYSEPSTFLKFTRTLPEGVGCVWNSKIFTLKTPVLTFFFIFFYVYCIGEP